MNSATAHDPNIRPKKSHRLVIILLVCILASCLLMISIGFITDRLNTDGASPYHTYRYRQASIEAMITACTEDFYTEPQPWMGLTSGTADVLIETRAPHIYCTTQLAGHIQILEVTDMGVLRTRVDLTRTATGPAWSYTAEVEFSNPPLP